MYLLNKILAPHKSLSTRLYSWIALFLGFGVSALWAMYPLFVKNIAGSDTLVGYFFFVMSIVGFAAALVSPLLFRTFGRRIVGYACVSLSMVLYLILPFVNSFAMLISLEVVRSFIGFLFGMVLMLSIKNSAPAKKVGNTVGRYYVFINIGWLIGPLVGGFLAEHYSYGAVFTVSALSMLCVLILFSVSQHKEKKLVMHHQTKHVTHVGISAIMNYFSHPRLVKAYVMSLAYQFWWTVRSVYIPLTLAFLSVSESVIGILLSLSILPLILFDQRIGNAADKRGENIFFGIGFVLLAIFTAAMHPSMPVIVVMACVILSHFGLMFVEPLKEKYFFSNIHHYEEEEFYSVYSTANSVGVFLSMLLASFVFGAGGYGAIWVLSGFFMIVCAIIGVCKFPKRFHKPRF